MMTRIFASVAVMTALGLLAPLQASAFGLGKIELSSALNEPLRAEIPITALSADDADNIQVRLASSQEFEQAGIDRNFLLTQLKFEVIEKSGIVKIVISSQQPVREPFIDFLLTASTTGSGRLIREYTVLLDPPKSVFNKPTAPLAQNPIKIPTNISNYSTPKTDNAASYSGNTYGPISRTDTLWEVALKTKPENSISVPQMMMALVNANPNAFQNGNVNGLKAGSKLSIPTREDIYKLTEKQALNAFKQQNASWKNRNARPITNTDSVDKTPTSKSQVTSAVDPNIDKVLPTPEAAAANQPIDPASSVDDTARLKLVVPTDKPILNDEALSLLGAEKIKSLGEQLTLAQETIEGQTQENIDFKSRMDALEVQMDNMRRLISLKDADLARLQSMVEQEQKVDENSLATDPALLENLDADTENTAVDTAPLLGDELNTSESDSIDNNSSEGEIGSLFLMAQSLVTNNKTEVAIGAGSLLLLLALLLIANRRREDATWKDDDFENDDKADEDLLTTQPTNLAEDKFEKAINVDEAQPVVETMVIDEPTPEELIEQADMLIAYGNYEKAMTLLQQAKQQQPTNQLVITKLLNVMFKLELTEPFVSLASSLNIDKNSSEWLIIAAWGRELASSNSLFHIANAEKAEIITNHDKRNTDKKDELSTYSIADKEVDNIDDYDDHTIEFNIDDYAADDVISSPDQSSTKSFDEENDNEPLNFDTSFSLDEKTDFNAPLNFEVDSDNEESGLSLDDEPLSLDLPDERYQSNVLSTEDSTLDNHHHINTNLDLDSVRDTLEFDMSAYDEIDEAETKLDLASAYADMGDPDGARNILEEVLKEGNEEQKSKAQALLMSLS